MRTGERSNSEKVLRHTVVLVIAAGVGTVTLPRPVAAKHPEAPETAQKPDAETTFLPHDGAGPFWYGGEVNSILQYHPGFAAPYSGPHGLWPDAEAAFSGLVTAFFAYAPSLEKAGEERSARSATRTTPTWAAIGRRSTRSLR